MTIDLFEPVASLEEIEGLAPSVLSIGSDPAIKYWNPWPAKAAADDRRMDTYMSYNLG